MGEGDPDLGRKLLKIFLKKLVKFDKKIDAIGCVNSGVYLTTEGITVIETLKLFESKGTKIVSCGTCLDHLGLRDKLLIGDIGTMDGTVEILTTADRIISPC